MIFLAACTRPKSSLLPSRGRTKSQTRAIYYFAFVHNKRAAALLTLLLANLWPRAPPKPRRLTLDFSCDFSSSVRTRLNSLSACNRSSSKGLLRYKALFIYARHSISKKCTTATQYVRQEIHLNLLHPLRIISS
jgi:hypothetical protein